MDPIIVGYLSLGVMTILIVMGMQIAFVTPLVAFLGIVVLKGWSVAFNLAGYLPHGIAAHYSLSVIPLFIDRKSTRLNSSHYS